MKFSLDDSFLAILMVGMLGLFGSLAYEAKHNGMTDPVVAASAVVHNAAAKSNTTPEEPCVTCRSADALRTSAVRSTELGLPTLVAVALLRFHPS